MLTAEGARLGIEAQQVIGLRVVRIAAGGSEAQNEMVWMVTEKLAAFTEAAATLATGGSTQKVVRRYRARVKRMRTGCHGLPAEARTRDPSLWSVKSLLRHRTNCPKFI
jgi:hypothetical protein